MTCSIPRLFAERLSRLGLACDTGAISSTLCHIGVRITPQAARFSATNGKILACFFVPIDDLQGDAIDLVIDREQFTTALKICARGTGRISIKVEAQEVRFSNGLTTAVARRVSGGFPAFEHVFVRTEGKRWVPTMSSLDGHLMAVAQKIAGNKQSLLFSSPLDAAANLGRLWAVPGAQPDESLPLSVLRTAVTAPAFWCDHELAILLMPITRSDAERQLDMGAFVLPQVQTAAVAA
jgi:hypothetical protein